MRTRRVGALSCLVLTLVLVPVAAAQNKNPTVLDRVQRVDDPELAELIRAAMAGRENLGPAEKLQIVRKVTLSYSQIKLLDHQIEQVSRKLQAAGGPPEMRYELLLARTELEAKLMAQLADLREVMGVVPKYGFDQQPDEAVRTRLHVNPVDDERVYVLDYEDPAIGWWAMRIAKPLGMMPPQDVLTLIRQRVQDPNNLPIRVDILWKNKAAEELHDKMRTVIRELGAEMQADVRLERNFGMGSGEAPFFLRQGKILTFYGAPVQRPGGPPNSLLASGPVDPADLASHILWRITFQWNVPFAFRIEYDQASTDLAQRVANEIRTVVNRLKMAELVHVKSFLVEPLPEAAFLGRWRAITDGDVREVVLQQGGQSELTMARQPDGSGGGEIMSCRWFLATREITIDLNRVYANFQRYVYRGHINGQGNLVLDRGGIMSQGSFGTSASTPIVFAKVQ